MFSVIKCNKHGKEEIKKDNHKMFIMSSNM